MGNRWKKKFTHSILFSYQKKFFFYVSSIVLLFLFISFLTAFQSHYRLSSQTLKNFTKEIDSNVFLYLMGKEATILNGALPEDRKFVSLSSILFHVITNVKPDDVSSLLGQELPGFAPQTNIFIVKSSGIDYTNYSFESSPPLEDVLEDREAVFEDPAEDIEEKESIHTTGERKVVFIYSSHNRESFLPHLPDVSNPRQAHHKHVNITKVSEHFAKALENNGIGTEVDKTDHMQVLHDNDWTYGRSYEASRQVIQEAFATNKDVQYIFDIHRDALPRDKTTITIDEKDYGQILIVVGAEHDQFERNLTFAKELHHRLEEKYPGLSKGVITKEGPGSNGIYNQDLLDTALLFEIGGYDNTLDELFRTVEILADVFSDYYWQAEKVILEE